MGWAGFLRKTQPNYVSPMDRVIEVTTRPWVTHGPGWAGLWAGLMRSSWGTTSSVQEKREIFRANLSKLALALALELYKYCQLPYLFFSMLFSSPITLCSDV